MKRTSLLFMITLLCSTPAAAQEVRAADDVIADRGNPGEVAAKAQARAAEQSVAAFHAGLVQSLQSDSTFAHRLAVIEPLIRAHFDSATIARLSLGASWRRLTDVEQEQFREALRDLIAATYADRFHTDAGQRFELVEVQPGRRGPVVRTRLVRQSGSPVRLDYHFRDGRIYNVVADGVSDLSLRRADYNSIVKQQGFSALMSHLQDQQHSLAGLEE